MKLRIALTTAGALVGLLTNPAAAQTKPSTVFGLTLGAPLALPVCQHTTLADGTRLSTYEREPAVTCYEPDIELSDAPWRRGSVDFPLKQMPLILGLNTGNTEIVDGKLEGLNFATQGYANTQGIIDELSAKFGKPTRITKTSSTIAGIAVPVTEAVWQKSDIYVEYRNIDDEIDYGSLLIETAAMRAVRAAHEKAQSAERQPL